MWTRVSILLAASGLTTEAHATCRGYIADAGDEDDVADLPCNEPYARWSIVPELSALVGWGPDAQARSVFGAELRLRNSPPWHEPSQLYTFGVGVETFHVATIEPYFTIGRDDVLERWCALCSDDARVFGAVHVALGAGAAWTATRRAEPFVLARVTFGLIYARPSGEYLGDVSPADDSASAGKIGRKTRFELTSQIDIVLETAVAADGEWRFAVGISLDPFRIIQDEIALDAP